MSSLLRTITFILSRGKGQIILDRGYLSVILLKRCYVTDDIYIDLLQSEERGVTTHLVRSVLKHPSGPAQTARMPTLSQVSDTWEHISPEFQDADSHLALGQSGAIGHSNFVIFKLVI